MPGMPERRAGPSPAALQSFLAFDFGTRRIGVASGNRLLGGAEPRATLAGGDGAWAEIEKLIARWQPEALVIGVPRHPDGAPHEMTEKAQRFGRRLAGRTHLPVFEVDERYTSVEAESLGARDVDAAAAALILEQFFRETTQRPQGRAAPSPPPEGGEPPWGGPAPARETPA
jgi:putative Holliday junction resolvase